MSDSYLPGEMKGHFASYFITICINIMQTCLGKWTKVKRGFELV